MSAICVQRCKAALEERRAAARALARRRRPETPPRLSVPLGEAAAAGDQPRRGRRARASAPTSRARPRRPGSRRSCAHAATRAVALCAKIELEISQLERADATAFLSDLGLASPDSIASSGRPTTCSATCPSSRSARTSAAPGRSRAARRRSSPPARSTATSSAGSSARKWSRYDALTARGHDGGVPRARRGPSRRQGIRRPGRRYHQFPLRHLVRSRPHRLSCEAQVPFVHGGAEILVRELAATLGAHGYEVEIVSMPFTDQPKDEIFAGAEAWRRLDLTAWAAATSISSSRPSSRPTSRGTREKSLWLVHQHRAAYELCGTRFSDFEHSPTRRRRCARRLIELDTADAARMHRPSSRSRRRSGSPGPVQRPRPEALYQPAEARRSPARRDYGDYVLTVARLEHVKRVDLAIDAFAGERSSMRLVIAGDGSARRRCGIASSSAACRIGSRCSGAWTTASSSSSMRIAGRCSSRPTRRTTDTSPSRRSSAASR